MQIVSKSSLILLSILAISRPIHRINDAVTVSVVVVWTPHYSGWRVQHTNTPQFLARRPSVCLSSVVCRLSVVCNVRAPYSSDWNFRQCFYAIWYLGHLWPFGKNFTEIVSGEPLRRGLNQTGVEKCSDVGPFQGYISETVKDRR